MMKYSERFHFQSGLFLSLTSRSILGGDFFIIASFLFLFCDALAINKQPCGDCAENHAAEVRHVCDPACFHVRYFADIKKLNEKPDANQQRRWNECDAHREQKKQQ